MERMKARWALATAALLTAAEAAAQARPRQPRRHARTPPAADANNNGVAAAPSGSAEHISVPVADVDRMMRQMRVWLFAPPAGATAYGLGQLGAGTRVWALLPSCRTGQDPHDPRDPCPVDRVVVQAEGPASGPQAQSMDPVGLAPGAESRRVQSFVIPANVARVHIRLMGLNNRVRYEALVDVARLTDLPSPAGAPSAGGFTFDLSQYPSR